LGFRKGRRQKENWEVVFLPTEVEVDWTRKGRKCVGAGWERKMLSKAREPQREFVRKKKRERGTRKDVLRKRPSGRVQNWIVI